VLVHMALSLVIESARAFALRSPAIFSLAVMVGLVGLIRYVILIRSRRLNFPIVGKGISSEMKDDLIEGAKKVLAYIQLKRNSANCILFDSTPKSHSLFQHLHR
jgi:hypothetical protein